ncbi:MAG TPA: serine/threonine-protein kinase, partial [Rudaea sp.]|nr:serine/threonine-protein kinase [Rudaea sp.]
MTHSPFESSSTNPDQPTVLDTDSAATDAGQTFACGQRLGPYRIEKLLGEGGMGAVYLAEQLEPLQRRVALKLIRSQLRGGLAEAYFLVERQALARMDHPAIAKVHDAGTTPQGYPFFAMEWIDGSTLSAYLHAHALSVDEKLELFSRICKGVQHAHQKGVIHRDLKPSNILVVDVDGQPVPKIIDFGIAVGATRNSGGDMPLMQRVGTHGYMSPEQREAKSGEVDIRSDVYALGVMLLEMLAPQSMLDHARHADIDNLGLHLALRASVGYDTEADAVCVRALSVVPTALRWVLVRAIDPDRHRRYESAQALADDLDRYRRNYPLVAVPGTRRYRLGIFARRNRGPLLAGGLIVAALIAGTTAAVLSMLDARAAAIRANLEAQKARVTSGFLTDVLSGIDPEQARDMDKTLLHMVLDRAAARAGKQLAKQPEVLAEIEGTIGSSYQSLSEYPQALDFTQRAYDVARMQIGADAVTTLKLQQQLAKLQLYSGKPRQALETSRNN